MTSGTQRQVLEQRQRRVATLVWGTLLMAVGVVLSLHNAGVIDLSSRSTSRLAPRLAVDGDLGTRWSSDFSDPQSITVDLGEPCEITRVRLHWESAHATRYQLQVSDDQTAWTSIVSVTDADGEIDEHDVAARGRYVRMAGEARATPYGYSLYEFEVFGIPGPRLATAVASAVQPSLLSQGRSVSASSREDANTLPGARAAWSMLWPVFLVAMGLPPLLAPKDGGEQAVGLLTSGAGTLLLVANFTSLGFRQLMPILIVIAGSLLVIQSLGRSRRDAGPDSESSDRPF
jgi:hypothetical protein